MQPSDLGPETPSSLPPHCGRSGFSQQNKKKPKSQLPSLPVASGTAKNKKVEGQGERGSTGWRPGSCPGLTLQTALQTAGRGAERPLSPSSHTRLGGKTAGAYLGGCWLPWSLSEGYGMIIPTLRGQRASCQCQNRDPPKAVTATLSSRSLPPFPCKKKKSLPARGESRAAERQPEHTLAGRPTADGLDRGAAGAVVRSLGSEGPPTWDHIPAPPEERAAWSAQLHLSP